MLQSTCFQCLTETFSESARLTACAPSPRRKMPESVQYEHHGRNGSQFTRCTTYPYLLALWGGLLAHC